MQTLLDRNIVVTGATQGLGRVITFACLQAGANVFACARDRAALDQLTEESRVRFAKKLHTAVADVRSPEDMERFYGSVGGQFPILHGLVNNAGVWGPKGRVEEVAWDDWRSAVETNLFGVVLSCRYALPLLRKAGRARVVNLSGGGATAPMPFVSAYAASKAGVVRFSETLAGEVAADGIEVNALAPGAMNTRMLDEILNAGAEKVGPRLYENAVKQKASGGASLERAANCCVWLLSEASQGITGKLISAVWDPWESLQDRQSEMAATDVYTLRRIVPGDRGLPWD